MATSNEILKEIIGKALLLRIGKRAVAIIKIRTGKGKFLPGSSPDADKYSTKPFAMPLGAVSKQSVLYKMLKGEYEETELFRAKKSQKLWVAISKGYKWLREQYGRGSSTVDLVMSRKLMRSLDVVSVDVQKGEILIEHRDKRSQQISEWHNILGAGKGKKVRKYLGLTDEELEGLGEMI